MGYSRISPQLEAELTRLFSEFERYVNKSGEILRSEIGHDFATVDTLFKEGQSILRDYREFKNTPQFSQFTHAEPKIHDMFVALPELEKMMTDDMDEMQKRLPQKPRNQPRPGS